LAELGKRVGERELGVLAVGHRAQLEPQRVLAPGVLEERGRLEGVHPTVERWAFAVPEREVQRRASGAVALDRGREPGFDGLALGVRGTNGLGGMAQEPGESQLPPPVDFVERSELFHLSGHRAPPRWASARTFPALRNASRPTLRNIATTDPPLRGVR